MAVFDVLERDEDGIKTDLGLYTGSFTFQLCDL